MPIHDFTRCPHCHDDAVTEGLSDFHCVTCGHWGPSPERIIYEPETEYRESGQVCRKPRAA